MLAGLGSTATTIQAAKDDPDLKKWINEGIAKYNKRAISNAQQIRYTQIAFFYSIPTLLTCISFRAFVILETDFTLENETLTPTMKLKRYAIFNLVYIFVNLFF